MQSFLFTSAKRLVREYFLHCLRLKQVLLLLYCMRQDANGGH